MSLVMVSVWGGKHLAPPFLKPPWPQSIFARAGPAGKQVLGKTGNPGFLTGYLGGCQTGPGDGARPERGWCR
jgi:hypothetical protein